VAVDISDEDGTGAKAGSLAVTVDNVAPTVSLSGATNVNEGATYTVTIGAVTDPGQDTVTSYTVHWGDGSSDTYSTAGDKTHTYADGPNSYTITVDLTDEHGTFTSTARLAVTADTLTPTLAALSRLSRPTRSPLFPFTTPFRSNEGAPYTLTIGAVTDPGQDTVTSYTVHWGDGSTDTYSTAGDKTHTYADGPNSYTITVDLTDEDGTFTNAGSLAVTDRKRVVYGTHAGA